MNELIKSERASLPIVKPQELMCIVLPDTNESQLHRPECCTRKLGKPRQQGETVETRQTSGCLCTISCSTGASGHSALAQMQHRPSCWKSFPAMERYYAPRFPPTFSSGISPALSKATSDVLFCPGLLKVDSLPIPFQPSDYTKPYRHG